MGEGGIIYSYGQEHPPQKKRVCIHDKRNANHTPYNRPYHNSCPVQQSHTHTHTTQSQDKTLEVSCVIDTINKAKARRNIDQPLIIHSDRGSQYVAKEYKKATENMQRSYSKKAFPWDNACIESFHSIIKREWLNRFKIRDYKQAYRLIFEYLEAFYNTKRIHSHCDFMSPDEFERVYERRHTKAELLAG